MKPDIIYIENDDQCPYFYTDDEEDRPVDAFKYVRSDIVEELRAENERLQKCCTQRGARMQIMREWMTTYPPYTFRYRTLWDEFAARKDALPWFDDDGVPVSGVGD